MTDFKKTNKKKLSNLVKRQLPEFVLEDHPKFAEFIKSYYLFLESAEIQLSSFTEVDNILLEGESVTSSYVLLDRTDAFNLDLGDKLVDEQLSFSGTLQKKEVITGATSGAGSVKLVRDSTDVWGHDNNSANQIFLRANGGGATLGGSHNITFRDSPSSTSSITYKTQFKTSAGTLYFTYGGVDTMILMEIAG